MSFHLIEGFEENTVVFGNDIDIPEVDILKQFKLTNTRKYGNQDNTSIYKPDGRVFSLGFRYNFGNMRIRDNYKSKDTDERDRL